MEYINLGAMGFEMLLGWFWPDLPSNAGFDENILCDVQGIHEAYYTTDRSTII